MTAYYNEFDKFAAEWLRQLIKAGHIAPGIVDERSIEDVTPGDLAGFTQCHFFAGIGVWSYALRRAGWPDSRRVWTASCPCQPFSAAGQGVGFADERHLWPAFYHLASQCRPDAIYGEQVASKDAGPWIDLVHTDMEALGYAFGAVPFPSASIGAPHIRDRLYWVALSDNAGLERWGGMPERADQCIAGAGSVVSGVADATCVQPKQFTGQRARPNEAQGGWAFGELTGHGDIGRMGDSSAQRRQQFEDGPSGDGERMVARTWLKVQPCEADGNVSRLANANGVGSPGHTGTIPGILEGVYQPCSGGGDAVRPGPTNGHWRAADWLHCRDGKWRPVSPLPQPLVDGSSESLGRVRPETITQIEKEINAATAQTQGGRAATMRVLLETLGSEAKRCWPSGGFPGLHEAPFLLAFMRQLQEQGWHIAQGISLPCPQTTDGNLRGLRNIEATGSAPCERSLDGQQIGESTDVVRVLSCLLARHASAAWGDAYAAHAEIGFPLSVGARSRVGRLRGYGNAINAIQAQIFVEATLTGPSI